MTKEQIEAMEAGPEMNALIAEKVMGWLWYWWFSPAGDKVRALQPPDSKIYGSWKLWTPDSGACRIVPGFTVPDYSGDDAAAWLVVERITQPPETIAEAKLAANSRFGFWWMYGEGQHLVFETAKDAAFKICRAALLAKLPSENPLASKCNN